MFWNTIRRGRFHPFREQRQVDIVMFETSKKVLKEEIKNKILGSDDNVIPIFMGEDGRWDI